MSLITDKLSLIHPDKISSPSPLCSIPEISYKGFTDYDKYKNEEIKYKEEIKLPDIKIHVQVQDDNQKLFYKRTETTPLLKKVTPPKVGQMAKYGQMTFEYKGGF